MIEIYSFENEINEWSEAQKSFRDLLSQQNFGFNQNKFTKECTNTASIESFDEGKFTEMVNLCSFSSFAN